MTIKRVIVAFSCEMTVGLDSLSHLRADAANHAIYDPLAFYRAAMPSQAAYRSVQNAQSRRRRVSRYPSCRHSHGVTEAVGEGTRA